MPHHIRITPALAPIPLMRVAPLLLLMVFGCSNAERAEPGSVTDGTDSAVVSAPPAPMLGDSGSDAITDSIVAAIRACPRDGLWHECSVAHRLELSGLRPRVVDSLTRIAGIARKARLWQIGRQTLRAVIFETEAQASAAMASLDSARAAPRGDSTVAWPERPTIIQSVNLVALMLGGSDRQVERVSDALTAGPPRSER